MDAFFASKTVQEALYVLQHEIPFAIWETFYVTLVSTALSVVIGYANDETIKLPSVYSLEATESVTNVNQKQVGEYFFPGNPDQANGSSISFHIAFYNMYLTISIAMIKDRAGTAGVSEEKRPQFFHTNYAKCKKYIAFNRVQKYNTNNRK